MAETISVAINTLNAETWLPYALRSVAWADERVVVDMHSDDRTVEIARAHGARVLMHPRTDYVEPARGAALAECRGDWVLILDADEMIPAPLRRALAGLVAENRADAARLCRLNYILGAPLRGTGWGVAQERYLRFFRRGLLKPPERIHGRIEAPPGARVVDLPEGEGMAIVHFNYVDVSDFVERLNRYTTVEARLARARGERAGAAGAMLAAAREVPVRWFRHRGWRDGWRGAALVALMACYRLVSAIKLRELEAGGSPERTRADYREIAEAILRGHDSAPPSSAAPGQAPERPSSASA